MNFDDAYSWALFSITFVSMIMQVYVIWMILTKSPPAMHEYRYFLCLYTVSHYYVGGATKCTVIAPIPSVIQFGP